MNKGRHSYLKYVLNIFISYVIFISIIALFGKGFSAIASLSIVLFSCGIAITFNIYKLQNFVFNQNDYLFIGIIFIAQAFIGIIHFDLIINPAYFSFDTLGVDLENGTYYYDIGYFAWLTDYIAEARIEGGYLAFDPLDGYFLSAKNYFLAYIISDLFYFGDAYMLNFTPINILAIFYSGVLLALITNKLFDDIGINNRRAVFYLVILQPIAWIPTHSMRDILGAFIVVLSVALVLFSVTRIQKIIFSFLSLGLVFQHRSAYFVSILGAILLENVSINRGRITTGMLVSISLVGLIYLVLTTSIGDQFLLLISNAKEISMLGGAANDRNAGFIEHAIKLIVGPFPWTQYFDGTVDGYDAFYSSMIMLQAAWHLTIIYFLIMKIKMILSSQKLRRYLYIVLLFAIPAFFSSGGMNLYLLPAFMLSIIFLHLVSFNRFFAVFLVIASLYVCLSALLYFSRF